MSRLSAFLGNPAQAVISAAKKGLNNTNSISFPEDIGPFFMSFNFYDYRTLNQANQGATANTELLRVLYNANRQNVQAAVERSSIARVTLPIPSNLVDSFRVDYQNIATGLGGTVISEFIQGASQGIDTFRTTASQLANGGAIDLNNVANNIPTSLSGIESAINGSVAGQIGIRALTTGIDAVAPGASGLIDLSLGVAANPNLAVLFKGPTLKQHTFAWKLSARTPSESNKIAQIIAIFKRAMHPKKLNNSSTGFLRYPAECLAAFNGPNGTSNFLYPLRPCVLENFSINYGPHGIPTFFDKTFKEVSVELNIQLQETSYYTRESFDDQNEIGSDGFQSSEFGFQTPGSSSTEQLDVQQGVSLENFVAFNPANLPTLGD